MSSHPSPDGMEIATVKLGRHGSEKALNISKLTIIFRNIFYCDYWDMELTESAKGVHEIAVCKKKKEFLRDAWVAWSVKFLTSAQVMFSWFVGSSSVSGSVLTAQSLEPASDPVSPSLCPFPPHALSLSVSEK